MNRVSNMEISKIIRFIYWCKDRSGPVRNNLNMKQLYGQLWSCPVFSIDFQIFSGQLQSCPYGNAVTTISGQV